MASRSSLILKDCVDADAEERRVAPRRTIALSAVVRIPGVAPLVALTVDVSRGGIGLLSPVAVELDKQLNISMTFDVCGESSTVIITGRVRYCARQAKQFRIGLQFVNLDAATVAFINSICA